MNPWTLYACMYRMSQSQIWLKVKGPSIILRVILSTFCTKWAWCLEECIHLGMPFETLSLSFNNIVPSRLITKLKDLGLNTLLCKLVLDFLTGRRQVVRVGGHISSTLILNTGAPQDCVLSPLLYSLHIHDCLGTFDTIVKFDDDTAVVGLITDNNEKVYLKEVEGLTHWCQDNNPLLNVSKTKEMIMDFGKNHGRNYAPLIISGSTVERLDSFKYLGIHITEGLTWELHTDSAVRKARQRLFQLRCLRKFRISSQILRNFYSCAIESVLTGNITAWCRNSTERDRKVLQRVVCSTERIIGSTLPWGRVRVRIPTTQIMVFYTTKILNEDNRRVKFQQFFYLLIIQSYLLVNIIMYHY